MRFTINEEGGRMWFKKKEKKENQVGFDDKWNKEIERYEKLLDAYELMVKDGGVPPEVLNEANKMKEYAEKLSVNSHDYYSAQNALTVLWDAYEILERGKRSTSDPPHNKARASEMIQCSNCLKTFDRLRRGCPVCGVEWENP